MATLRMYLRRDRLNGSNQVQENRFLFLPVEKMTLGLNNDAIKVQVPLNDSRSLYGGVLSNNILLNLGKQVTSLAIEGTLQPLDDSDYPALPSASNIKDLPVALPSGFPSVTENSGAPISSSRVYEHSGSSGLGTTDQKSALAYRDILLRWISDQGRTSVTGSPSGFPPRYANFRFGWGNYRTTGFYQEFKGMVLGQTGLTEESGYLEQFKYSLAFQCGNLSEAEVTAVV